MRNIASRGYKGLTDKNCAEVAEFLIQQSLSSDRRLDLRLLVNSFGDRLQWEHGNAEAHWQELVTSRLQERVAIVKRSGLADGRDVTSREP